MRYPGQKLGQRQEAPLQQIQDEQGYLVVARWGADPDGPDGFRAGDVLARLVGGDNYFSIESPVRVIARATRGEFEAQHRRYLGPVSASWPETAAFGKVVAE
jgi:hypothetical protein